MDFFCIIRRNDFVGDSLHNIISMAVIVIIVVVVDDNDNNFKMEQKGE